jgi:hypothetical protein
MSVSEIREQRRSGKSSPYVLKRIAPMKRDAA